MDTKAGLKWNDDAAAAAALGSQPASLVNVWSKRVHGRKRLPLLLRVPNQNTRTELEAEFYQNRPVGIDAVDGRIIQNKHVHKQQKGKMEKLQPSGLNGTGGDGNRFDIQADGCCNCGRPILSVGGDVYRQE